MSFLPPMTGNGNHITYLWVMTGGMVNMTLFYPHVVDQPH